MSPKLTLAVFATVAAIGVPSLSAAHCSCYEADGQGQAVGDLLFQRTNRDMSMAEALCPQGTAREVDGRVPDSRRELPREGEKRHPFMCEIVGDGDKLLRFQLFVPETFGAQ